MTSCPKCGKRIRSRQVFCPVCSNDVRAVALLDDKLPATDIDDLNDANMTVVARFQNAAEAGYFADELGRSEQIPVTVALAEERDGVHGFWSTRFHLLVPDAQAERAATALERLVVESESDEPYVGDDVHSPATVGLTAFRSARGVHATSAPEGGAVNWLPIVLTLTAGSAAMWGLRQIDHPPQGRQPVVRERVREEDLWSHFSQSSEPWLQRTENGRGIRELRVDRTRNLVIIREDADGDGFFEAQSSDTIDLPKR